MKKPTKPKARGHRLSADPPELLPEWMDGTPSMIYTLEAFHEVQRQRIDMTLAEFTALKIHLCRLRGFVVSEEVANATEEVANAN